MVVLHIALESDLITQLRESTDAKMAIQPTWDSTRTNETAIQVELSNEVYHLKALNGNLTAELEKYRMDKVTGVLKEFHSGNSGDGGSGSSPSSDTVSTSVEDIFQPQELCFLTKQPSLTASQLWRSHLPQIINASQNPDLPQLLTEENKKKMQSILEHVLTPPRLRRAVLHLPTFHHNSTKHIVEILQKRLSDPDHNRPLQVAVFGGSVTIGRDCALIGHLKKETIKCAWPHRLELLVNQMFDMELVKVTNLGVGGTASGIGTQMMKYWIYPDGLKQYGPDIIINSYSTNDSLPRFNTSETDIDKARDAVQSFVRTALESKPCGAPPLVVHVDDYLGPQQDLVLGEMKYNMAMVQLAKWYDTVAISYADVVRDIVYSNTSDRTFFKDTDVHYGIFAHQSIAWSVAFSFLEMLSNYCDDEYRKRSDGEDDNSGIRNALNVPILPPPLTKELMLKNVTRAWDVSKAGGFQSSPDVDCKDRSGDILDPCIVSWIAQPGLFGYPLIEEFKDKYEIANNGGWAVERSGDSWAQKVGIEASRPNASMTLRFKNIASDVKTVTIFFMKSYGEKWKDSRAKFSVRSSANETALFAEFELSGENDVPYSLTYSEKFELVTTVNKGESLSLRFDLVKGSAFKVLGMMLCLY